MKYILMLTLTIVIGSVTANGQIINDRLYTWQGYTNSLRAMELHKRMLEIQKREGRQSSAAQPPRSNQRNSSSVSNSGVKGSGAFRPQTDDTIKRFSEIGTTAGEKQLMLQVANATKTAFEKQTANNGWKNNVAGALTFFIVSTYTVYNEEEPDEDIQQSLFDLIDSEPALAEVSNKEKQQLYNLLLAFGGLPLAVYTEGTQTGNRETVETAKALAKEFIKIILNIEPEELSFGTATENSGQNNSRYVNNSSTSFGDLTKYVWRSRQNRRHASGMGDYAGRSTNTYQFFTDGTYKFTNETFQYNTPKYYLVNETGNFSVNGNSITLSPTKSLWSTHQQKKTDPALRSGQLSLNRVQYRFEYTSIYDRLRLVLSPANGNVTDRDGTFNYFVNGDVQKSYLYDAEN